MVTLAGNSHVSFRKNCRRERSTREASLVSFHISRAHLLCYTLAYRSPLTSDGGCVHPSVVSDSVIPRTVAHHAPLSMGFPRQGYWSGLPFPSPGDLPEPGIEPRCPALQASALTSEPPGKPHPLADNWIKAFLSKALHTRAKPSFSNHQSLPSRSLHEPLSLLHQRADKKQEEAQSHSS